MLDLLQHSGSASDFANAVERLALDPVSLTIQALLFAFGVRWFGKLIAREYRAARARKNAVPPEPVAAEPE